MINFIKINKVYLILLILFTLNIKLSYGIENKIIFKINDKAFTSLDYELRVKYLDFVGNNVDLTKKIIVDDFISANIFFEFYNNSDKKNDYTAKIKEIYNNIKEINNRNNKIYKFKINEENILFNIKIDFIRKTILENLLNSNLKDLNKSKEEIDLLYKFNINYINFKSQDNSEIINTINTLKDRNVKNILNLLEEFNINYFIKEYEINNINEIDERIRENILLNEDFFIIQNSNDISLIFIEKRFETLQGLVANIYSIKSNNELDDNFLKCHNLIEAQKTSSEIISKEYKFLNLNNKLRNNLINIDDYIKLTNDNNENIYIVLCNIKFDLEKLNNIDLDKFINSNVNDIEKNFIIKYSRLYNLVKSNF